MRAPVVALVLAAAAASPAAAQVALRNRPGTQPRAAIRRDTVYVDAVIRLDIDGGPSAVLPALVYNSTLMLPVRQFFELAEIRMEAYALRDSAVAVLQPGNVLLRFRPGARELTRGGLAVPYDTLDVVWWENDLFVATGLLDTLLGVSTRVEWSNLSAMVGRATGLPVIQRARRERRRQQLGGDRPAPDVLEIPLRERTVDGVVGTWALTAATRGPTDQVSLDIGLGGGLLGGSAELRRLVWNTRGASGSEFRASWSRVWPRSRWLRQLRVGDVFSSGRRARLLRGVVATSAPFIRSIEFDAEDIVGHAPAGWEVELYDRGRLMGFAEADAVGAFRVPLELRYGQNPFELVLYGPGGETVRQRRTIRVPFARLPAGRLEYAIAGGACAYDPCDAVMSADARYGLSSRVTLQGGWDVVAQDGSSLWQPYAIVSTAPAPAFGFTGEAVANGHVRLSADYEPTADLRLSTGHTRIAESSGRFTGAVTETARSEGSLYWRPGWMEGLLFFQGTGVVATGPRLSRSLGRLAASTRIGLVRYSLGFLVDAQRVC